MSSDVKIKGVARGQLAIYTPYNPTYLNICKVIPGRRKWDAAGRYWTAEPSSINVEYLRKHFGEAEWDTEALALCARADTIVMEREALLAARESACGPEVADYRFHTKPYDHQRKAFALSRDLVAYALFMEQGTGKSKVIVDTSAHLFLKGSINAVVIVSPNFVKLNWPDEWAIHLHPTVERRVAVWESTPTKQQKADLEALWEVTTDLKVLIINVEAFSSERGAKYVKDFVLAHSVLMAVDESTRIKTPGAKRTKQVLEVGKHAKYRRIATGTPMTQSPLDIYAQFKFLDPYILGFSSFSSFRSHYAVTMTRELKNNRTYEEVVGYQNVEDLERRVAGHSFRVLKKDCLDMPERIYQTVKVALTPEQGRIYKQMKNDLLAQWKDASGGLRSTTVSSAAIALTQLIRLHQIAGGFVQDHGTGTVHPIPGPNPKMAALLELLEDVQGKVIIWSRFVPEVKAIVEALADTYGPQSVVALYGEIPKPQRKENMTRFQTDPTCRWYVGQTATGIGINLSAASTHVFFSNDFSLDNRLQCEERNDRADAITRERVKAGEATVIIDLVAQGTIDKQVLKALRGKRELADLILKDGIENWLNGE